MASTDAPLHLIRRVCRLSAESEADVRMRASLRAWLLVALVTAAAWSPAGASPASAPATVPHCRTPGVSASGPVSPPRSAPTLVCNNVVSQVMEVPAARASAPTQPAAGPTAASAAAPLPVGEITRWAFWASGGLGALGALLLLLALVPMARGSAPSFDGVGGGFGGRAYGWKVSPSLALLVSSAFSFVLATLVAVQLLRALSPTPAEPAPAASAARKP